MGKNAIVITNGCPENRIDCAEIELFLKQNGWEIAPTPDQADVFILNLCGLINETEEKSLDLIKMVNGKKKPNTRVLVTGCLPKINNASIKNIFQGEIIKGHNIKGISEALGIEGDYNSNSPHYLVPSRDPKSTKYKFRKIVQNGLDPYFFLNRLHKPEYRKYWDQVNIVQPDTYYIKVCSGCLHKCAYCAVKISRGTVKSKPIEEIKAEFIQGLEKGHTEFSFIGTDLGSYGKDQQKDLLDLLKEIVSLDGKFEIRLRNVHPQLMINKRAEFVDVTSTGKITHITSAIQHGNDRILGLMNRPYKIDDCKSAFNAIINSCPDLKIRSQLMVGFPGETEEEFNDTLRLIDEINLGFVEVYPFSPRAGTLAAKMPHQVPQRTINRRQYLTIKKSLEVYKQREKVGSAVN